MRTRPAAIPCGRPGFTLVELLVVIGIIALLISVLLPALNRARAQANLIDCQARMRQMGQAITLYVNQHNGYLPASYTNWPRPPESRTGGPGTEHDSWRWMPTTLTRVLKQQDREHWGTWHPLFTDKDATDYAQVGYDFQQGRRNHYNFNMRVFVNTTLDDRAWGRTGTLPKAKHRRLSTVRNTPGVIGAYDGVPWAAWSGNAFHLGDGLRSVTLNFLWYATQQSQVLDVPNFSNSMAYYDEQIIRSSNQGHVDWRHGQKDTANVLMLDGHVEARKFDRGKGVGDMRVREFCTNRPPR